MRDADVGGVRGGAGAVADHGVPRQVHLHPRGREREPYRVGRGVCARVTRACAASQTGRARSTKHQHDRGLPCLRGLTLKCGARQNTEGLARLVSTASGCSNNRVFTSSSLA